MDEKEMKKRAEATKAQVNRDVQNTIKKLSEKRSK